MAGSCAGQEDINTRPWIRQGRGVGEPYNSNKATAEGHDGHASGHSLDEDVLHGCERKANVLGNHAEQAKAHQACRQRHGTDPTRDVSHGSATRSHDNASASLPTGLQSKVHVGKADNETD